MARVDLRCRCGHTFFVGDAQAKEPGGVECPACLERVRPTVAASPAGRLPSRAQSRGHETSTAKLLAAVVQPVATLPPSKKKWIVLACMALAFGGVAIVVIKLIPHTPTVDYAKQEQAAAEARKRKYEEFSKQEGKPEASSAPAPSKAAAATDPRPVVPPPPPSAPMKAPSPVEPQNTTSKPATVMIDMNAGMVERLRSEVLPLHPFYLNLVVSAAEKSRLEGIGAGGRGTVEDAELLESVLGGGKLKAARQELGVIGIVATNLERDTQQNLPVDKIALIESGRILHGKIVDEGEDVVKVLMLQPNGSARAMPIRKDAISRIEKGKGLGTDFATRWETAKKGTTAVQGEVLAWCKENTLPGLARLVAFTILRGDPSHQGARAEAGLPPDPVKYAEDLSKGGLITYQGKVWSPKPLKEKLLADGFSLMDGKWYAKKEKTISAAGLFRYEKQQEKPVTFSGTAPMVVETDTTYSRVQDSAGMINEKAEVKELRRFYSPLMLITARAGFPAGFAPPPSTAELQVQFQIDDGQTPAGTKMTGEVVITVPVGAPILEASVFTTAEVKPGGSITVYCLTNKASENEKRTKLYTCDPKEVEVHPIPPELLRGTTEVTLVAVIEQVAAYTTKVDRRHVRGPVYKGKFLQAPGVDVVHHKMTPDYKAVLFPSFPTTSEAFRLKAMIADPAPQLDKLFEANPDALK